MSEEFYGPANYRHCWGMPCPQPVLRAKQALEEGAYAIEVLVDNEASQNNVTRFGRSQGHTVQTVARGNSRFAVTIVANGSLGEMPVVSEDYQCQVPKAVRVLYVISSDTMGRGSEQLGWALLQTYVQTIKDVSPQPHKIVLYNSGVRLVATESGALEALRSLQAAGVGRSWPAALVLIFISSNPPCRWARFPICTKS